MIASVVTEMRLRRRGVAPGAVFDIAIWAVPFGIVGARIYHVATSYQNYFGPGQDPLDALKIWQGGLGIWGAVAGGAVGAWLAGRQLGIPLSVIADALAPGLPLAQAVGRFGNWFNNELYGAVTTLPWGLEVHRMDPANPGQALRDVNGNPELLPGLYHPTFAYEALWNVGVALLIFAVDRRFKLGRGRAFALYVMGYTAGRFWIEMMRTDTANEILGVRLNVWTAALVFLGALLYFLLVRGPRQYLIPIEATGPAPADTGDVSRVDVQAAERARREEAVPAGYRVVTEEQFQRYQDTGEVPAEPETSLPTPKRPTPAGRTERFGSGRDGCRRTGRDRFRGPDSAASDDPRRPAGRRRLRAPADPATVTRPVNRRASPARRPSGTAERDDGNHAQGPGRGRGHRWSRDRRRAVPLRLAGHRAGARRPHPGRADRAAALAQRHPRAAGARPQRRAGRHRHPAARRRGTPSRTAAGWSGPGPSRPPPPRWWCTGRTCTTP